MGLKPSPSGETFRSTHSAESGKSAKSCLQFALGLRKGNVPKALGGLRRNRTYRLKPVVVQFLPKSREAYHTYMLLLAKLIGFYVKPTTNYDMSQYSL